LAGSRPHRHPEADAPFVLQKSYFGRERFEVVEARNGLKMHFAGWSQPLESYMAALENAGLAITSLREPIPDTVDNGSHMERWKKIPLFLWLKAIPFANLISGSETYHAASRQSKRPDTNPATIDAVGRVVRFFQAHLLGF
jgi:hypothetical protein